MDVSEDVDFDFFDTPRNDNIVRSQSGKLPDKKPDNPTSGYKQKKGDLTHGKHSDLHEKKTNVSKVQKDEYDYSDDTFSSSDSESDTSCIDRSPLDKFDVNKGQKQSSRRNDSLTESSSAYSNSDSSDLEYENNQKEKYNQTGRKEMINVHIPKTHVEAWNEEGTVVKKQRDSKHDRHSDSKERKSNRKSSYSESAESEVDKGHSKNESVGILRSKGERARSAKTRKSRGNGRRKTLRSSSSYSNNSDITDVSPLESPQGSPRLSRKSNNGRPGKENGKYKNVQYSDESSPERIDNHSIKLESDEIDLSILMKCMADIEREKQERLKANSRRVMFAQPAAAGDRKNKGNYTFSSGQAKLIEKENQRLLKQIMNQMNSSTVTKNPAAAQHTRGPRKATAPIAQRLTPSAVNRMREQRRIEDENMHMLSRLQCTKPSKGMSRSEQITEAQRQMSYGIPSGTVIIKGQGSNYDTMSQRSLRSSMSHTAGSTQRSRPSSAKSNMSVVISPGKRSRPSSAKSNASLRSNASMRSNMSKMSNASMRSNVSGVVGVRRMADGRIDKRPQWDDRFSFA